MKSIILSSILFLSFLTPVFAQKNINERDVPQTILADFKTKEPKAENPKWMQLDSTTYEVKYVENTAGKSIRFTKTSTETRWDVKPEWMPAKIKSHIDSTYPKAKIESLSIADVKGAKSYEVTVKQKKNKYLIRFGIDSQFIDATEIKKK